jgi:hypothetical protein
MSNTGRVFIKDLGLKDYTDNVESLKSMFIKAGYPEAGEIAAPEDGKEGIYDLDEMITIVMAHEFGLGVPERSFMRAAIDENIVAIEKTKERLFDRVALGKMTADQAMSALGSYAVGIIRKKIIDGPFEKLKEATIKAKGSSKPLVDSGQMKNTVQFVIQRKRS